MIRLYSSTPFEKNKLLLGLLVSIVTGTLALIVAENIADIGIALGAFLGGLIAGRFTVKPLSGGSRGAAVGILSLLLYYFFIVPMLYMARLITIPDVELSTLDLIVAWIITILELVGVGFVGGVAGYYMTAGIKPVTKPSPEVKPTVPSLSRCPRCGSSLPVDAIYCPQCGLKVRDIRPV
ncbi:MAG: zinc ribbon domain-containing protein [Nitrososphaerota archaeon]|nr:zinc ribbon domain-containing protein [Candidatus Bathyarchaeota archaeon]MCX8161643.1 zinc ribbon domain-containing protein [Candidatus Bathyarchaeota archaeon]MDW8062184.1 zinc ribbon domain-containing protein [Nitrososphaerota archaeon]